MRKKSVGHNKAKGKIWISEDIKHGDAEHGIAQLVFVLDLVQCFFIMLPFLHFGKVMCILCHCILEVCDLLFNFGLQ